MQWKVNPAADKKQYLVSTLALANLVLINTTSLAVLFHIGITEV